MNGLNDGYLHGLSSSMEPASASFCPSSMPMGSSFMPYQGSTSLSSSFSYPSSM